MYASTRALYECEMHTLCALLVEMSLCVIAKMLCGLKCCRLVLRVLAFTGQRTGSWGS
jgi:hypothetical protein